MHNDVPMMSKKLCNMVLCIKRLKKRTCFQGVYSLERDGSMQTNTFNVYESSSLENKGKQINNYYIERFMNNIMEEVVFDLSLEA